jgi:hypothetical protein
MRTAIYDAIKALGSTTLGTFSVSSELPYDASGTPLYLKNFKKIYVDVDQVGQEATVATLDGSSWVDETTTVRAYFVTDAKLLPSNYETLVDAVKETRLTTDITAVTKRRCQVSTRFEADALVTEFEFSFTKQLN